MSAAVASVSGRISTPAAMEALGGALAAALPRGIVIHLCGPLAAGKTTFARGYLHALGHTGAVKSPTYTLVESYLLAGAAVHHFDLYRLADPDELEFIGIDAYFGDGADVLIEWPERGVGVVPAADVTVSLVVADEEREVRISASEVIDLEVVSNLFRS